MSIRTLCSLLIPVILALSCRAQDSPYPTLNKNNPFVFPREHETFWRTLSSATHLIGVSVLAYCFARRIDRLSYRGWSSPVLLCRWLVVIIFVDSWLFIFISGLLVSGVGLSLDSDACTAGIFACITLYALSKLFIYWFLSERVHMVHSSPSRLKSTAYRICLIFVFGYVAVIILAITGRVAYLRDGSRFGLEPFDRFAAGTDGACVIGIGRTASMTLLVYDLFLNVLFTCMFLYPIYRSGKTCSRLKKFAKRTLIAAIIALVTSAINICVLMILHGRELGWICLASCGSDITVNALAIYFVTSPVDEVHDPQPHDVPKCASTEQSTPVSRYPFVGAIKSYIHKFISPKRPLLPISNAGITSSTRGILETSSETRVADSSRSVHFLPEVTRQRPPKGYDIDSEGPSEHANAPDRLNNRTEDVSNKFIPPTLSCRPFQNGTVASSPEREGSTSKSVARSVRHLAPSSASSTTESEEMLTRRIPSAVCLHLLDVPPLDEPEDTTLEIRQEGRISRNPRRHPPCLVSMAVAHARKRSKSVDDRNEEEHSRSTDSHIIRRFDGATDPPVSVEEARTRLKLLSTLTDIAGKKRDAQASRGLLEVSVVTQLDQRIERRCRRDDLLDDYNGSRYIRRGRSCSSSGGL